MSSVLISARILKKGVLTEACSVIAHQFSPNIFENAIADMSVGERSGEIGMDIGLLTKLL